MPETWTVKDILSWMEGYLAERGDESPRLSAQWLVSDALGMSRIQLYADYARPLTLEERSVLRGYTRRRGAGEPLQYITGTVDFRFITLAVESGVLIPRPETEVLVSEALSEVKARRRAMPPVRSDGTEGGEAEEADGSAPEDFLQVLDLCTGTGCIACSIATENPSSQVMATDIDGRAVALAARNASALGVSSRVEVIECDLGEGVPADHMGTFDLVIANPPYIPTSVLGRLDSQVVDFEPSLALDGGDDGLDIFRRILPFAWRALAPHGVLAIELHETCLDEAASLASDAGFGNVRIARDLADRPRVLVAGKGE
jgi:release factor glutamine methyltransferase